MVQSGHVGECAVVTQDYDNANCHALIILSPDHNEKVNSHFVFYYFYSHYGKKRISEIKTGNTIEHVLASEIKEVNLNFPTPKEQTKIAEFLSAVDDKISQLSRQLELLNQYKKGVMQKIFSQEIRFKNDNGEDFGEWVEKKLSQLAYITTGSSNREDSLESDGQYTFFDRSEDIRTSNKYLFDCEALIVGGEGSSFKPKYFKGKFDLHQRAYAIMKFEKILAKYLYFYMQFFHQYFLSVAVGTTVKSLRLPMFNEMPVLLPEIQEQEKIAEFLTAIDERIDHTTAQLTQTKQWKKGLLQQMFV